MATASLHDEARRGDIDLVDRWFRALDQRSIHLGIGDWLVQVTSILVEEGVLWIQIADDTRRAGSVVLRVASTTPVEQAVYALKARAAMRTSSYPTVICASATHARIN
jgi:hypothetical protein